MHLIQTHFAYLRLNILSMKFLTKLSLPLILLVIMLINTTCSKQKWFSYITYEGHVYDKSGNPAPGILITLKACGGGSADSYSYCPQDMYTVGSCTADASGYFKIHQKESRIDVYFVIVGNMGVSPKGVNGSALKTSSYTHLTLQ